MKHIFWALGLGLATLSTTAHANNVWLVKCGQAASEAQASAVTLKGKGVNVFSVATDESKFRNDVCGEKGVLLAFYLRASDRGRALDADTLLKDAPAGYPPAGRKVH